MAYSVLVSAGGAGERNCDAESSTNGVIDPIHGVWADWADGGGANTHVPGRLRGDAERRRDGRVASVVEP